MHDTLQYYVPEGLRRTKAGEEIPQPLPSVEALVRLIKVLDTPRLHHDVEAYTYLVVNLRAFVSRLEKLNPTQAAAFIKEYDDYAKRHPQDISLAHRVYDREYINLVTALNRLREQLPSGEPATTEALPLEASEGKPVTSPAESDGNTPLPTPENTPIVSHEKIITLETPQAEIEAMITEVAEQFLRDVPTTTNQLLDEVMAADEPKRMRDDETNILVYLPYLLSKNSDGSDIGPTQLAGYKRMAEREDGKFTWQEIAGTHFLVNFKNLVLSRFTEKLNSLYSVRSPHLVNFKFSVALQDFYKKNATAFADQITSSVDAITRNRFPTLAVSAELEARKSLAFNYQQTPRANFLESARLRATHALEYSYIRSWSIKQIPQKKEELLGLLTDLEKQGRKYKNVFELQRRLLQVFPDSFFEQLLSEIEGSIDKSLSPVDRIPLLQLIKGIFFYRLCDNLTEDKLRVFDETEYETIVYSPSEVLVELLMSPIFEQLEAKAESTANTVGNPDDRIFHYYRLDNEVYDTKSLFRTRHRIIGFSRRHEIFENRYKRSLPEDPENSVERDFITRFDILVTGEINTRLLTTREQFEDGDTMRYQQYLTHAAMEQTQGLAKYPESEYDLVKIDLHSLDFAEFDPTSSKQTPFTLQVQVSNGAEVIDRFGAFLVAIPKKEKNVQVSVALARKDQPGKTIDPSLVHPQSMADILLCNAVGVYEISHTDEGIKLQKTALGAPSIDGSTLSTQPTTSTEIVTPQSEPSGVVVTSPAATEAAEPVTETQTSPEPLPTEVQSAWKLLLTSLPPELQPLTPTLVGSESQSQIKYELKYGEPIFHFAPPVMMAQTLGREFSTQTISLPVTKVEVSMYQNNLEMVKLWLPPEQLNLYDVVYRNETSVAQRVVDDSNSQTVHSSVILYDFSEKHFKVGFGAPPTFYSPQTGEFILVPHGQSPQNEITFQDSLTGEMNISALPRVEKKESKPSFKLADTAPSFNEADFYQQSEKLRQSRQTRVNLGNFIFQPEGTNQRVTGVKLLPMLDVGATATVYKIVATEGVRKGEVIGVFKTPKSNYDATSDIGRDLYNQTELLAQLGNNGAEAYWLGNPGVGNFIFETEGGETVALRNGVILEMLPTSLEDVAYTLQQAQGQNREAEVSQKRELLYKVSSETIASLIKLIEKTGKHVSDFKSDNCRFEQPSAELVTSSNVKVQLIDIDLASQEQSGSPSDKVTKAVHLQIRIIMQFMISMLLGERQVIPQNVVAEKLRTLRELPPKQNKDRDKVLNLFQETLATDTNDTQSLSKYRQTLQDLGYLEKVA